MKLHRINALLIRHLYLYKQSFPRIFDIFFWPLTELILWGFLSVYLNTLDLGGAFNLLTVLLGAIIFWDLMSQSQRAVAFAFFEDIWERNLLNLFVSPLKLSEFLVSTLVLGLIRILLVGVVLGGIAFLLYSFNILEFGFLLVPFALNLLFFGWLMGIFSTAVIFRFGSAANAFSFGLLFIVQPLSAVFYPVSALPDALEWISRLIPLTHVFEGMRHVVATGVLPSQDLIWAFGMNFVWMVLIVWFFHRMFARIKEKGTLMKLD